MPLLRQRFFACCRAQFDFSLRPRRAAPEGVLQRAYRYAQTDSACALLFSPSLILSQRRKYVLLFAFFLFFFYACSAMLYRRTPISPQSPFRDAEPFHHARRQAIARRLLLVCLRHARLPVSSRLRFCRRGTPLSFVCRSLLHSPACCLLMISFPCRHYCPSDSAHVNAAGCRDALPWFSVPIFACRRFRREASISWPVLPNFRRFFAMIFVHLFVRRSKFPFAADFTLTICSY